MQLIIAGSRSFQDFDLLERETLKFIKQHKAEGEAIAIISGMARGADSMGEVFAEKYKVEVIKKKADWDKFGKIAGYIRNKEMANIASHCILFWDGVSKGTKSMSEICHQRGIPMKLVKY